MKIKKQCDLNREEDWKGGLGTLGRCNWVSQRWSGSWSHQFPLLPRHPTLPAAVPALPFLPQMKKYSLSSPVRQSKRPYWSQHLPGASGQCPAVPQRTPCPGTSHCMRRKSKQPGFSTGPWRSGPWIARIHWVAQTGLVWQSSCFNFLTVFSS